MPLDAKQTKAVLDQYLANDYGVIQVMRYKRDTEEYHAGDSTEQLNLEVDFYDCDTPCYRVSLYDGYHEYNLIDSMIGDEAELNALIDEIMRDYFIFALRVPKLEPGQSPTELSEKLIESMRLENCP